MVKKAWHTDFFTTWSDKTPKEHSLIFKSRVDFIRQTEKHNPIRPHKATAIMKNEAERIWCSNCQKGSQAHVGTTGLVPHSSCCLMDTQDTA